MCIIITQTKKNIVISLFLFPFTFVYQDYIFVSMIMVFGFFGFFELIAEDAITIRDDVLRFSGINTKLDSLEVVELKGFLVKRVIANVGGRKRLIADSWRYSRSDIELLFSILKQDTSQQTSRTVG